MKCTRFASVPVWFLRYACRQTDRHAEHNTVDHYKCIVTTVHCWCRDGAADVWQIDDSDDVSSHACAFIWHVTEIVSLLELCLYASGLNFILYIPFWFCVGSLNWMIRVCCVYQAEFTFTFWGSVLRFVKLLTSHEQLIALVNNEDVSPWKLYFMFM